MHLTIFALQYNKSNQERNKADGGYNESQQNIFRRVLERSILQGAIEEVVMVADDDVFLGHGIGVVKLQFISFTFQAFSQVTVWPIKITKSQGNKIRR